jgi:hypothetical protein
VCRTDWRVCNWGCVWPVAASGPEVSDEEDELTSVEEEEDEGVEES